ncbi:MAG: copper amine oxidase N-terminal domain-containing protein [Oscillospiraceae bacterium]|nr:copper amine oxidase N-terminal domain-containing protein [Oscillospiraceae bacterium]
MKPKKILMGIISTAVIASAIFTFSFSVQAENKNEIMPAPVLEITGNIDISTIIKPMPMPTVPVNPSFTQQHEYTYIDGTINEIKDYIGTDGKPIEGKSIVNIVNGDSEWNAIIDSGTYAVTFGKTDRKAMSVGDDIRVFYNAKAPALMIYPPQLNAEFIALNFPANKAIKIDRFDANFLDSKNQLKLNITDDYIKTGKMEIVYQDGKAFDSTAADLTGRQLVVIYSVTTASIPAQTTPDKIIIMYEQAVAPTYKLTDEEKLSFAKTFDNAAIQVNGKAVDAPHTFVTENGVVMVPFRAIAEAMGLKVEWFDDTRTVQVGKSLSFVIGKDQYAYNRMAPVSFGTAPIIRAEKTFVPIDLFTFIGANYMLIGADDGPILNIIYDTNG